MPQDRESESRFCRNVLHGASWAWAHFHPFPPGVSVRHPQPGPRTVSMSSCLHLGPCPGWGPAPHLDQSCLVTARPLHDPVLMAPPLFLGPHPCPVLISQEKIEHAQCRSWKNETTLCPRFRLSQSPPPTPGSYLTGNVFLKMNLQTSQQTVHSKNKQDPNIFVPKM